MTFLVETLEDAWAVKILQQAFPALFLVRISCVEDTGVADGALK